MEPQQESTHPIHDSLAGTDPMYPGWLLEVENLGNDQSISIPFEAVEAFARMFQDGKAPADALAMYKEAMGTGE